MPDRLPKLVLRGVDFQSDSLQLSYGFDGELQAATPSLHAITELFVANAAHGAFSAGVPLAMSIATTQPAADSQLEYVLSRTRGLERHAFQCLRNMARRLRRDGVLARSIGVTGSSQGPAADEPLDWPSEQTEETSYSRGSERIEALIVREDSDFAKSRRCLVRIAGVPDTASVEAFEAHVRPWYLLLEAGGYAMPIEWPEDSDCIAGSVSQFDEQTIEIAVSRFQASELAWIALANMAVSFWGAQSIERIIID